MEFSDGAEEIGVADARQLDRILEGEEQAGRRTLLWLHGQDVLAEEGDRAARDLIALTAGEHIGERRFARAVGTHDGMNLALGDREIDALEDFLIIDRGRQALDFQHLSKRPSV